VSLEQYACIVVACRAIIRGDLQHGFEQYFRIVEHLARQADTGEQAHRFNIVASLEQIVTDDLFGRLKFAIREMTGRAHDIGRQPLQRGDVRGGGRGVGGIARHSVEAFEQVPARRQRRVDIDRMQQRFNRARRIAQHHVTVTALLVHKAVERALLFHSRQRLQRGVDLSQVTLTAGGEIQPSAWSGASANNAWAACKACACCPSTCS
jgi:hypothetical protein